MVKDIMSADTWNMWYLGFAVGERRYFETTKKDYLSDIRALNKFRSNGPAELKNRVFSHSLFTAVGNTGIGDIRYLLCVERVE